MEKFHIFIIGGGGTGGALAHDLALRGFRVTLAERGELTSGTTGRHHGLLHSGGRYAVSDKESAIECIEENTILRRIMPGVFEENDGLFVAVNDADVAYSSIFLQACAECGIPTRVLSHELALRLEPNLFPDLKMARPGAGCHDGRHAYGLVFLCHGQAQWGRDQTLYRGR